MNSIQRLRVEIDWIAGTIQRYSNNIQITNYLSKLQSGIACEDYDVVIYCIKSLLDWYDIEIKEIAKDPIGAGYDTHQECRYTMKLLLDELEREQRDRKPNKSETAYPSTQEINSINRKVFIVHGHDDAAKYELARILEKFGLEAVILHEQADSSLTIIEKIEHFSDVCFSVVLYTECDLGREKTADIHEEKFRARQNVVFEHGFLIGKLGRQNVCALVKGNVETPGDISGVVYTKMDSAGGWIMRLLKSIQAAGIDIDTTGLIN